jgi:CHAD domain-containing protein
VKLQPDQIEKPLRKLRKQLKRFPQTPQPEEVHLLRTQTRRLEAIMMTMALQRGKKPHRLLSLIKPVRKAAGDVRDMDVLIGDVLTIGNEHNKGQDGDAAVRLVEHLARMRVKSAHRLHELVRREGRDLRDQLKQSSELIRKKMKSDGADMAGEAAPRILITELSHWPQLDESNLHVFRIRIKELRYMLQLNAQADDKLVETLGEVKDTIGEWHDWVELGKIARRVIGAKSGAELLKRIERIGGEKLQVALSAANRVRERYFGVPDGRKTSRKILQMAS